MWTKVARTGAMLAAAGIGLSAAAGSADWSAARIWDEQILAAIRINLPRPPVHARNLYHTSVAMYDAWAAYDQIADGVVYKQKHTAKDIAAARHESISYAAYRVLKQRFATGPGSKQSQANFDAQMLALGYDMNFTSTKGDSPAAIGNRVAAAVLAYGLGDGGNEAGNYGPNNGYQPVNDPLIIELQGTGALDDPNRWQPLAFDFFVSQNGIPKGALVQSFVCPHWLGTKPFALRESDLGDNVYLDLGPQPHHGGVGHEQFIADVIQLIEYSSFLDPADGVMMDISPASIGNNPLGSNSGTGYPVNPVTGVPYPPQMVLRADYRRVMAEFWADGPHSETPPGHWHVIANEIADTPGFEKRIGGTGPIVDDLEWDVKMYVAIAGAAHDAAIVAWSHKGFYDSVRPITAIRYMAQLGQSTDLGGPSYHPLGLPLIDGLVSVVTEETIKPGGIHEHIPQFETDPSTKLPYWDDHVGDIAIMAWQGQPEDPKTEVGGVNWIVGKKWFPYQASTFVTPPFAGYTSGHSTFSRATAEVMAAITGSPYFPGGLGEHVEPVDGLEFEAGPSTEIRLQWATYFDAADEAAQSRLWGGIHPQMDDFPARITGSLVGQKAWANALRYFNGTACPTDFVNDDEVVGLDELYRVLQDWGDCVPGQPCFADTNVNGKVDVEDLLQVINDWGGCK